MANAILKYGLDECAYQLEQVFSGVEDLDAKPITTQMSPREMLTHLAEVYHAVLVISAGGKHEWGSYRMPEEGNVDPKAFTFALRAKAVAALAAQGTESADKHALEFLVLHDPYHIGQMVQHRLQMEPGWNSYSIYRHESSD